MESKTTAATYYRIDFEEVNIGVVDTLSWRKQETIATKKAEIDAAVETKSLNQDFVSTLTVPNWVIIKTECGHTGQWTEKL